MRATGNRDQSSSSGQHHNGGEGGPAQGATRSLSGSKFSSSYAQQLKKQVQASSQANNIDPLSTKQYLQNYLSEHPTSSSNANNNNANGTTTSGASGPPGKASVPLKIIKQVQQAFGAQSTTTSANNNAQTTASGATQFKQNYQSQSKGAGTTHDDNEHHNAPSSQQQLQQSKINNNVSSQSQTALSRHHNVSGGAATQIIGRNGGAGLNFGTSATGGGRNDMHTSYQVQSQGQLQGSGVGAGPVSGTGLGTGIGETVSFDRRKDRASSSSKHQKLTGGDGALSRSLVRPSSKNRLSSQQPTGSNLQVAQKIFPSASGKQGSSQTSQSGATGPSQGRGTSPKIPQQTSSGNQASNSQLNMSGQNLQHYFMENRAGSEQAATNSGGQSTGQLVSSGMPYQSKNLPRKKRITVQQQQSNSTALIGSSNHAASSGSKQGGNDENSGTSQSIIGNRVAAGSRLKHSAATAASSSSQANNSGLPPMSSSTVSGGANTSSSSSTQQQRAPSPGLANKKSGGNRSSSQTQQHGGSGGNRPTAANHDPQPFQKEELFLNVDSQYNDLIMQMIQPNRSHFDFEGSIQYVMNASELSNQALAKLLYSRKNIPMPKLPEGGPNNASATTSVGANNQGSTAAVAQFKTPGSGNMRSRNLGGGVGSHHNFGRNGAAGQSTASFFNTKKSFQAATFSQASSGLIENGIRRTEGYHDGPDSEAMIGKDFYQSVRSEVRTGTIEHIKQLMPDYQSAKFSAKRNGIVAAYGANTNQGIVRNYNEDRVAIILNIMKPKSKQYSGAEWPKCSFFGIYDGHGGHVCADFLRDYLHQFIIKDQYFPKEPIKAIKNGFKEAEKLFLEFAEGQQFEVGDIDRSGSCAIVALIIDDMCYIGNTGDSRACMSADGGKSIVGLSNDHKPTDDIEMFRILNNNGRIYQNASIVNVQQQTGAGGLQSQIVLGPHRVFPGRLSVCRTFGDIEAKLDKLDGNQRVVVADPDVTAFKIDRNRHDFIVIGCDGIFDKLENRDCVHLVWQACLLEETGAEPLVNPVDEESIGNAKQAKTQDERRHKLAGLAVDSILKACAMRRSCDNITSVVIGFDNFYRRLDECKLGSNLNKGGSSGHQQQQREPSGHVLTSNDHEVFEEIQMTPVGDSNTFQQESNSNSNNVIYIESDDHLESITESQNMDQHAGDESAKDAAYKGGSVGLNNKVPASAAGGGAQAKNQSDGSGSLLYGETGTTNPSGTSNSGAASIIAHQQMQTSSSNLTNMVHPQLSAMTMLQNGTVQADGATSGVQNPGGNGNPYHLFGNQDKILSEIAEEDSISMISDKPRRFKPSDCVTPADPVTNSFMGSTRESNTNATNTRLKETANRMVHENINSAAGANNPGENNTGHKAAMHQQTFPYTQQQQSSQLQSTNSGTVLGKSPLVGGGSSQITQKRPPSATKHLPHHNVGDSDQHQRYGVGRPLSGTRSGSGQNNRLSQQQQQTSAGKNTSASHHKGTTASSNLQHHMLESSSSQQQSSQQLLPTTTGTRTRQTGRTGLGATSKISAYEPIASSSNDAYGGVQNNQSQSSSQGQQPQQQHSHSQQSLMPALLGHHNNSNHGHNHLNNSHQSSQNDQQNGPNTTGSSNNNHSNSASTLYQVKKQTRRSSNQSHQRGTYGNGAGGGSQNQRSQQQIVPAVVDHRGVGVVPHGSGQSQSQSSMPPPQTSSTQLLPMANNVGSSGANSGHNNNNNNATSSIQLMNQKRSNQQSSKSADAPGGGKKAKTQQPNKLVELFRQVDGTNQGSGGGGPHNPIVNTTNSGVVGGLTNQFVPKGSLSSNNQMLMRTMQMNNPLATHGAQVHNIQIKPISATKRRAGGPQNLMQAQFHNSGGQNSNSNHQNNNAASAQQNVNSNHHAASSQNQSSSSGVNNILNHRTSSNKGGDKTAQFSQTSVLNSGSTKDGMNQAKQPSNKLISQYLAQVNQNSHQHHGGPGGISHNHHHQNTTSSSSLQNNNTTGGNSSYSGAAGGAYASRSTRNNNASSDNKPSPGSGVLSRAQRVQMTYNQSLPQSKTTHSHGHHHHHHHHVINQSGSSGSGSRQQSSHSNHHPAAATHQASAATASSGQGNGLLLAANSAYAQATTKGGGKSRNGSNSQTAVSHGGAGGSGPGPLPPGGGSAPSHSNNHQQANQGHASTHHLPKWQSLNTKQHGNGQ